MLRADSETDLIREMEEIGVDPQGIALMAPKGMHFAMRLESLSPWQANLVKQEMLSLGADAAVHRGALDCSASSTSALLMGTAKQFRALVEKLEKQPPTMKEIGAEIAEGLARYGESRFSVPLETGSLELGSRTAVMGIVNVSPDSFYDGGRHFPAEAAIEHGLRLADEGADIIDIGGESTRPGADPVPAEEEARRVLPVIEGLSSRCDVPLSVDTYKSDLARRGVEAGAVIVNDVSGLRFDDKMARTVAECGAGLVVMHMQGEPRTMQAAPLYENLMAEIVESLDASMKKAVEAGCAREKILVDPGIGFGKKAEHNFHLLRHLSELRILGRPILVGPSRKSFIGSVSDLPPDQRLEGTLAAVTLAVLGGAHVVRVHDVQAVKRAVQVADAVCRREP